MSKPRTKPSGPPRRFSADMTDADLLAARLARGTEFFASRGYAPFPFQLDTWRAYLSGESGLVNAPTGSGKTYSLVVPILLEGLLPDAGTAAAQEARAAKGRIKEPEGLRAIWISPIRALTKEIASAAQQAVDGFGLQWRVGVRTGDTPTAERAKQKRRPPQILITTPESLHLILSNKDYPERLSKLRCIVADEWHELLGTKRGVQLELGISRLRGLNPKLKVWGISATIVNLEQGAQVLLGGGSRALRSAPQEEVGGDPARSAEAAPQ